MPRYFDDNSMTRRGKSNLAEWDLYSPERLRRFSDVDSRRSKYNDDFDMGRPSRRRSGETWSRRRDLDEMNDSNRRQNRPSTLSSRNYDYADDDSSFQRMQSNSSGRYSDHFDRDIRDAYYYNDDDWEDFDFDRNGYYEEDENL